MLISLTFWNNYILNSPTSTANPSNTTHKTCCSSSLNNVYLIQIRYMRLSKDEVLLVFIYKRKRGISGFEAPVSTCSEAREYSL